MRPGREKHGKGVIKHPECPEGVSKDAGSRAESSPLTGEDEGGGDGLSPCREPPSMNSGQACQQWSGMSWCRLECGFAWAAPPSTVLRTGFDAVLLPVRAPPVSFRGAQRRRIWREILRFAQNDRARSDWRCFRTRTKAVSRSAAGPVHSHIRLAPSLGLT